jgi:hypothetical protein
VTEAQLQEAVRQLAVRYGWLYYHTHDSRKSPAGFPDVVLVRRGDDKKKARLIIAELKNDKEKPTADQQAWLDALGSVRGEQVYPHDIFEAYLWRPSDLQRIADLLR